MLAQNIIDGIIPEPLGGAHKDFLGTAEIIKVEILRDFLGPAEIIKVEILKLLKALEILSCKVKQHSSRVLLQVLATLMLENLLLKGPTLR